MAKVRCEPTCYDSLLGWMKEGKFKAGVMLGHCSSKLTSVVHLVDHVFSSQNAPADFNNLSETTFIDNSVQILRMLPGGLDVIGIYLVTSNSVLSTENSSIMKGLLRSIFKNCGSDSVSNQILLIGDLTSQKILSKQYLASDINSEFVSSEIENTSTDWVEMNYLYTLDSIKFMVICDHSLLFLKEQSFLLDKLEKELKDHLLILFDHKVQDSSKTIGSIAEALDEKISKTSCGKSLRVEVLQIEPPSLEKAFLGSCGELIELAGTLAGRAYVPVEATFGDAVNAVHKDLVQSLLLRWQMHCDSIIEEPPEFSSSSPVFHEPPRRVFFKCKEIPLSLCDYLFPGDTKEDACVSAKELLGIEILAENIDDSVEKFIDSSTLNFDEVPASLNVVQPDLIESRGITKEGFIIALLCIVVSFVLYKCLY